MLNDQIYNAISQMMLKVPMRSLNFTFLSVIGSILFSSNSIQASLATEIVGEIETVLSSNQFSCSGDGSDVPASAFRRADGSIVFIAGNRHNIVSIGSTWDTLDRSRCTKLIDGGDDPDPAQFNDQKWVTQLYSFNGRDVTAFIHQEYHGEMHGGDCRIKPIGDRECWYASSIKAVSNDGGLAFKAPAAPENVIIAPSSQYITNSARVGTFMPKVVGDASGKFVYLLVSALDRNSGTKIGQCLLRSTDQSMAKWQLWDGRHWSPAPENPYTSNEATRNNCRPVIAGNILGVRFIPTLKSYVVIGATKKSVYLRYSRDLVNFGSIHVIDGISPSGESTTQINANNFPHKRWYFSLLDPLSKSRNFDTVSLQPYLYFVEFGENGNRQMSVRNLRRVKVNLTGD